MSSRPILSVRTHRTLAEQLQSALTPGGAFPAENWSSTGNRRGTANIINGSHRSLRAREVRHD